MNNIRRKSSRRISYFCSIFCNHGDSIDLPTEFLTNPNRDANYYATEYLQIYGVLILDIW